MWHICISRNVQQNSFRPKCQTSAKIVWTETKNSWNRLKDSEMHKNGRTAAKCMRVRTRWYGGKMWNRRAEKPGRENFLILIKFSFFFTAARRPVLVKREDIDSVRKSSVKERTLEHSQRIPGGDDWKTQTMLETGKENVRKSARTYVRFSCRSFASVSGAAVLLPQCSRSSLSRLPSPAAIAASLGSSAGLWTKRPHGILWLDSSSQ